ncbi:hypothetical protein BX666DRAFT_2014688 [Dichotomocladium elegans]|nr:hypothetical protein BX666DRAFT_2016238 [Dichotomocladium elegans]KAI9309950.1 hypothetical protein BX666DRAFT_2014688 [Dichotomocladium elegans]
MTGANRASSERSLQQVDTAPTHDGYPSRSSSILPTSLKSILMHQDFDQQDPNTPRPTSAKHG